MIKKTVLENELKIVTEYIPHVKSVCIGVWVKVGSKRENSNNNGVSHFIEHMMFKGTKNRTAKEIAESIDNIGGQINAFTSKEYTCYYIKVLYSHIDIAIDVLSDMIFNSEFDATEIDKEKSVVLEEIKMYEDSPDDLVSELLAKSMFEKHELGRNILGTEESLMGLSREDIIRYYKEFYVSNNAVISIVGNFDEKDTIDLLKTQFGNWKPSKVKKEDITVPVITKNTVSKVKDIEQAHLCIGMEGLNNDHKDLYALIIINNILGGGMSSRLFQTVREEMGLVYTIYSYLHAYEETGTFNIYAGMNEENLLKVSEAIVKNINILKEELITEKELEVSKEQLKGSYMLGLESTYNRMSSIGKAELLKGKINTQEEIIAKIDKVNIEDIERIINKVFDKDKVNISIVGNIKNEKSILNQLDTEYNKII